jgi:hypothetical protein
LMPTLATVLSGSAPCGSSRDPTVIAGTFETAE